MTDRLRVAMWSGPRNLSTAMMRSFENRPDCEVWDEPFYAAYLTVTGIVHPMREAVIAGGETDWRQVACQCIGAPASGAPIFFQKHMTHHMVAGIGRDWIEQVTSAFLIRDPAYVVASYGNKRAEVQLRDIGFTEQYEIFHETAERLGRAPPVVDADDVRREPRRTLMALCQALDIPFDERMLSWPAGSRASDEVWPPEHLSVDHVAGRSAPEHSLDGTHVGGADAREALVGEAQRVGREYHVVHCQQGIVRVRRLALKHVQPGPGNNPLL